MFRESTMKTKNIPQEEKQVALPKILSETKLVKHFNGKARECFPKLNFGFSLVYIM